MGTALLALSFCALSLVLALFVGISPISDKAKIRFMYVGAALSLMAVPMRAISHKVNHKLPQKVSCTHTIHSTQHPQILAFTCISN